jgi:mono/diheme cytochrome c family protein
MIERNKLNYMKRNFLFVLCLGLTGVVYGQNAKPWSVPDKDAKVSNPVKADATSIAEGKTIYAKHCQSCHGKTGAGDGPKAAKLKTQPEDLKLASVQKQTDGALFYKTAVGRDDMPSFRKKLDGDDDVWNVVNYLRALKK